MTDHKTENTFACIDFNYTDSSPALLCLLNSYKFYTQLTYSASFIVQKILGSFSAEFLD